ncbi:hypothetical protein JHK82_053281 [Glycine max]|nr:hypothetical protein JHK86_053124 [Glycine max]KAG5083111.1 hypothetical protein JHK84_053149 [Glycine max]KAG5085884.1 hypothetical protein JHK82_053281 [Glycine max]
MSLGHIKFCISLLSCKSKAFIYEGGFDTESIEAFEELRSRIHAPPGEDNNQKHS